MPVVIFQLITRISMRIKRVLGHALLLGQVSIVFEPDSKIAVLANQAVGHIAAMKVAAMPSRAEFEASRLITKAKQRQPAEVTKKTVDSHVLGVVPEIRDLQVPRRSRWRLRDSRPNLLRPGILQNLVTIDPQNPLGKIFCDFVQQEVLVPSFVQSLEGRTEDDYRLPK